MPFTKIICNLFQGLPNPGFRSVKVEIDTFFKKDSRDLKNSFHLGFLCAKEPTKRVFLVHLNTTSKGFRLIVDASACVNLAA